MFSVNIEFLINCRIFGYRLTEAEIDCDIAIRLDPTYTKAYLRRATARASRKNELGAIDDYETVLKLEPSNKQAADELKKLLSGKKPNEKEQKAKKVAEKPVVSNVLEKNSPVADPDLILPIKKPVSARSTVSIVRKISNQSLHVFLCDIFVRSAFRFR